MPTMPEITSFITTRRRFLVASGATLTAPLFASSSAAAADATPRTFDLENIKALVFDTVGTLVDSYATVVTGGARIAHARGVEADWDQIYTEWNAEWRRELNDIIAGHAPWRSSDAIYKDALDKILVAYPWGRKITPEDRGRINQLWYELKPWPDAKPGLERLRKRFTLATLSNASMASLIAFIKQDALPVDCILTAELVHSGKPDPKVYALAARTLNVSPDQILMVAAHKYDLAAAAKFGFRTAFVPRPYENGPKVKFDGSPEPFYDLVAPDLIALAAKLA